MCQTLINRILAFFGKILILELFFEFIQIVFLTYSIFFLFYYNMIQFIQQGIKLCLS